MDLAVNLGINLGMGTMTLPASSTGQHNTPRVDPEQSFEVVASAFEKMVFDQVFSFTPLINEQDSKLGLSQKNSLVNDLFKDELHNQSKGVLMEMFLKNI